MKKYKSKFNNSRFVASVMLIIFLLTSAVNFVGCEFGNTSTDRNNCYCADLPHKHISLFDDLNAASEHINKYRDAEFQWLTLNVENSEEYSLVGSYYVTRWVNHIDVGESEHITEVRLGSIYGVIENVIDEENRIEIGFISTARLEYSDDITFEIKYDGDANIPNEIRPSKWYPHIKFSVYVDVKRAMKISIGATTLELLQEKIDEVLETLENFVVIVR